jgi:D-glycero-D-manno-heptose 1,7-bisphosphate phosphatase
MLKVIVLDRDGVVNEDSPLYIKSPAEWHALPGSLPAIAKLNHAGYKVVVATNQSGVARGLFTAQELENIHQKMRDDLAEVGGYLDGVFVCPHGPQDNCLCRKPQPGLLLAIAKDFQVKPEEMLVVGDSMRDILAARAAGCQIVLVKTGNGQQTLMTVGETNLMDVKIFPDLATFVDVFLQK